MPCGPRAQDIADCVDAGVAGVAGPVRATTAGQDRLFVHAATAARLQASGQSTALCVEGPGTWT